MSVIIGDVHQFIGHCLVPLDPCIRNLPTVKFNFITVFRIIYLSFEVKGGQRGWDKESKVFREIENWIELNAGINYIGQAIFTLLPSYIL